MIRGGNSAGLQRGQGGAASFAAGDRNAVRLKMRLFRQHCVCRSTCHAIPLLTQKKMENHLK